MNIRLATVKDLENIMQIYSEARNFMGEQKNASQWGESYPPKELVKTDICTNCCYVVEDNVEKKLAGVFYYSTDKDECYDRIEEGCWRNDRKYAVVHRVAVSDKYRGRGIAGLCLDYVVECCKKTGIMDIRMDTHRDNLPMQRFFEKHDFRYCGVVYVEDKTSRLAYHKIIIKNIVLDVGQVLLEFDWRRFIENMDISEEKKKQLSNITLGNIAHWNMHDRGMQDDEFIEKSVELEPGIRPQIEYYMKNIGTIVKEYDYSVLFIKALKSKGYMVYILSNYGKTPFKYAREHMKFFDEVDGMIISSDVGVIKPEPDIYKLLVDKYELLAGECVFIDDREDNIQAAKEMGMSGIVFDDINRVVVRLNNILCETLIL